RESVYTANFMKYGFTPGFGSTAVFPTKLGLPLAQEFLLTARTFRGAELAERGVPFPVHPRARVLTAALDLAEELVEKPRRSLVALKDRLVGDLRARLPAADSEELAMHELTFHQPEVRALLNSRSGEEPATTAGSPTTTGNPMTRRNMRNENARHEEALSAVTTEFGDVIPEVGTVSPRDSMRDPVANSIDRAEIITATMERLDISLPLVEFAEAANIGDIVAIMSRAGARS